MALSRNIEKLEESQPVEDQEVYEELSKTKQEMLKQVVSETRVGFLEKAVLLSLNFSSRNGRKREFNHSLSSTSPMPCGDLWTGAGGGGGVVGRTPTVTR